MKMKRKYTKRKPKAPRKPTGREYAVASYLAQGDKPPTACRKAGYSESTVRSKAPKIARSDVVQAALAEIGRRIPEGQLGQIAKARLAHQLATLPNGTKHAKVVLGYIRTGAEVDRLIGGPEELHLHSHQNFPPQVCKMLAEMTAKILVAEYGKTPEQAVEMAQCDSSIVLDVEAIRPKAAEALQAETPEAVEPPKPEEPISLSFQEKQDRYIAWQASLIQNRSV